MQLNKIYNIDCFEGFKELENKSLDYVFTSPPYNRKRNDKYEFYNDIIDDYYSFLCRFTDECLRISKKLVFVNIQKNYYNKKDVFRYIGKYADKIKDIVVWEKSNPMPASGNNITNSYEYFIVMGDVPFKSNTTYTKNIITTSVNTHTSKLHKAIMNQEVSDWFIEKFTQEGESILDPFMGSGTTALSCIKYNRKYVGFEIVEEYFNLSQERIKNK